MKNQKILFLLFLSTCSLFAQKPQKVLVQIDAPFYIGKKLMVETVLNKSHSEGYVDVVLHEKGDQLFNELPVKQNSLSFFVSISYPTPFSISYFDEKTFSGVTSDLFFIDPDQDTLRMSIGDLYKDKSVYFEVPTPSNLELKSIEKSMGKWELLDISSKMFLSRQKKLASYLQEFSSSYVGAWLFIIDFQSSPDLPIFKENKELISAELRELKPFKFFSERVEKVVWEGDVFPFELFSYGSQIKEVTQNHKYMLVEYWATWCGPCIQLMPKLKEIYNSYQPKGFNIINISIDNENQRAKVEDQLKKSGVSWLSVLDAARECQQIGVYALPYNFLMDSKGVIVKVNVSMGELEKYLKKL